MSESDQKMLLVKGGRELDGQIRAQIDNKLFTDDVIKLAKIHVTNSVNRPIEKISQKKYMKK